MSKQQKLQTGQIKLKPIHFESNADRVSETEVALNEGLDNFLSQNNIHVTHAEREFTLQGKSGLHKYNIVLQKDDQNCVVKQTVQFAITQCSAHKEQCQELVQDCLDQLAPQNLSDNEVTL